MPRTNDLEHQRKMYSGMGDGLAKAIDLVTSTAVWAAIGFGVDKWLGTWPVVFAIGAVIGNFTGLYVLYRRSIAETGDSGSTAKGVSRSWPPAGRPAIGDTGVRADNGDGEDR
jgi:F0F1-type ATP synthase assembly protein I